MSGRPTGACVSDDGSGFSNRLDGSLVNTAVQAQVIQNLYINSSDGLSLKPQQVPSPTRTFTNQVLPLEAATRTLSRVAGDDAANFIVFSGPPGIGKREISRYWLRRHLDHFPDGQFYADLAGGPDQPGLVGEKLREFLLAVGCNPAGIPDSVDGRAARFRSWSAGRRVAIVLDNAWSAAQVRSFTPGPGASSVVVSAAARLIGLGADETVTFVEVPLLDDDAARALLVALIGERRVSAEPEAVGSLLRMCGGLTIAVRVLASLLESFPSMRLSRLIADLEDERRRPRILSPAEDRSVYAVFSNAYDRVSASAQHCYRVLGRHPGIGDVSLEVLAAGLGLAEDEARYAVNELVSVALVTSVRRSSDDQDDRDDLDDRYRMHELMRWHAQHIDGTAVSDSDVVLERMLAFYHERVVIAGYAMMPGRGWNELLFPEFIFDRRPAKQVLGQDPRTWLETERNNVYACVETAYRGGQFERVCHFAVMLWPMQEQGKHLEDQIAVNQWGLEAAQELGNTALMALIGIQRGFPHLHLGQADRAFDFFSTAMVAAQASGLRDLEATSLESLGLARLAQEQPGAALALLRRNLDVAMELGAVRRIALARLHLGKVEEPAIAVGYLGEAREAFLGLVPPDIYNAAKTGLWLGRRLTDLARFEEAAQALQGAMAVMTQLRRPFDCLQIVESMGDLAAAADDTGESLRRYREALTIAELGGFGPETIRLRSKLGESV